MDILILGGTGAIGEHLVTILDKKNNNLYVTSRKKRLDKDKIHYIQGNAHDKVFLKQLLGMRTWDVIIDFMVYTTKEFQERVPWLLKGTKHYIFLSTSRVYAGTQEYITESSPRLLDVCKDRVFLNTDDYALTKARQEDILMASGVENWTIIRPYITFSENRLQLGIFEKEYWLYRVIHGSKIIFSQDIAGKYTTLTYGNDVAKGIAALAGKKEAFNESFHITTDTIMKWSDILNIYVDTLEEVLGSAPKVLMLDDSEAISYTAATAIWALKYDRLLDRRFDNSKFMNVVGKDFHFEDVEGRLRKCIRDFFDNGSNFNDIYIPQMAYMDRIAKERTRGMELKGSKEVIKYYIYRNTPYYVHRIKQSRQNDAAGKTE